LAIYGKKGGVLFRKYKAGKGKKKKKSLVKTKKKRGEKDALSKSTAKYSKTERKEAARLAKQ